MITLFWICTILTTILFFGAGFTKLFFKKARLKSMHMDWVEDFSEPVVKLIASAETVGALGVLLPIVSGVAPLLSPIAATCLTLLMLGAVGTHLKRKEAPYIPLVLAVIAAVTAALGYGYLS